MTIQSALNTSNNQLYFCKIFIDEIEIVPENILSLTIREWILDLSPRLELVLNDDGMLSEVFNIDDNANIRVELAKNISDENPIELDFMVQDYNVTTLGNNRSLVIEITGLINSKALFTPIKNRSFSNRSSINTLSVIADECGLTFNAMNNVRTSDNMTWLQINQNNFDFIKHVTKRSYKSNDALFCYCDIYNNLNFASLRLECTKAEVINARYDLYNFSKNEFENTEDANTLWFNYYDYTNLSGKYNKTNNYGRKLSYYDLNDIVSEEVVSNESLLAETTLKDKDLAGKTVRQDTYGIQSDNVHDNYHLALSQNDYFKKNFCSFVLSINVNPIKQVKLFDLIDVMIPSLPNYSTHEMNDILSGKYIVGGIMYNVTKNGIMKKQLMLFRDGVNKGTFVEKVSNNK